MFTVSASDKGDFPAGKLAWDVLNMTALHKHTIPACINLHQCLQLKPYAVACLAALGARAKGTSRLILPKDSVCRQHLLRLGLPNWFAPMATPPVAQRQTNVPIQQCIQHLPTDFSNRAVELWGKETGGLDVGQVRDVENHIDEMIMNALGHSFSPVGCFVVGQAFQRTRAVEVAILDLGITIRGHLTRNSIYGHIITDEVAIQLALREGVTGTPRGQVNLLGHPNSGAGLTELHRYCQAGMCDLTILSGSSYVSMDRKGSITRSMRNHFEGTLVNIRFRSGMESAPVADDDVEW